MSNDSFIPENYEAPTGGGGFTKLQTGDNRMRILSNPLMMWSIWLDGKPSRVPFSSEKPAKGGGQKDSVKHAWGLIIWNYATEAIEVFELDKQDIIQALTSYAKDADWGHPKNYDIIINKTGAGMDTEYKFIAKPAKPITDIIIKAYTDSPIDLNQLLVEGGNPFLSNGGATSSTEPAAVGKVSTPENTAGDGPAISEKPKTEKKLPF
ncbi:MAG: hypothetical protein GY834_07910 [Bacteroidetes bacterium]|nr:hypothetical protein [Bacteroidota bacterium]